MERRWREEERKEGERRSPYIASVAVRDDGVFPREVDGPVCRGHDEVGVCARRGGEGRGAREHAGVGGHGLGPRGHRVHIQDDEDDEEARRRRPIIEIAAAEVVLW